MDTPQRIILGIDPGSRCTGYGIISVQGSRYHCITYGQLHPDSDQLNTRLYQIQQGLMQMIEAYRPQEVAIEQIFTLYNHQSALKLGQARGAALVATARHALPLSEYSARQIKQAVVGYGAASKSQIQHMVKLLLQLKKQPPADAADALAIALCHANSRTLKQRLENAHSKIKTGVTT